jgi:hypothetical protein
VKLLYFAGLTLFVPEQPEMKGIDLLTARSNLRLVYGSISFSAESAEYFSPKVHAPEPDKKRKGACTPFHRFRHYL